jgi:DNA processing protein
MNQFGSLETAWKNADGQLLIQLGLNDDYLTESLQRKKTLDPFFIQEGCRKLGVRILHVEDEGYPDNLKTVSNPPVYLFVRGELPSFHKSVAVVGTRNMTAYGRNVTQSITADLVRSGFVIVSGLAIGIDAAAHRTALECGGMTVAVLGSGVDQIYPRINHSLAQCILGGGGCLISQFPLGCLPEPFRFPVRNEVVAGLVRGTLVTEGGIKSGALITARLALDMGRDVFAVPNDIHKSALSGTNHLIRRGEAKLVESAGHILEEFRMEPVQQHLPLQLNEQEGRIVNVLSRGEQSLDQLCLSTGQNIQQLSVLLVSMSLRNIVKQQGEKWVLI